MTTITTWHLLRAACYDVLAPEKTPPGRPWAHLLRRPVRLRSLSSFSVYGVAIHPWVQPPRQWELLYRSRLCPSLLGTWGTGICYWICDTCRNRCCAFPLYIWPWDTRDHA